MAGMKLSTAEELRLLNGERCGGLGGIEQQIAAVLAEHRSNNRVPARCFGCDWKATESPMSHPQHVAALIIAAFEGRTNE